MIGILALREEAHNKILKLRSILNTMCKPQFEILWDNSTTEQQEEAKRIVELGDKDALGDWMSKHPSLSPAEMSWKQLASAAQKLRIKNYSRSSKVELIAAVEKRMTDEEN